MNKGFTLSEIIFVVVSSAAIMLPIGIFVHKKQAIEEHSAPDVELEMTEKFLDLTDPTSEEICVKHLNVVINDVDLKQRFFSRVQNGWTCSQMIEARKNASNPPSQTLTRYTIVNDETVIFTSTDAVQLAKDMEEVKNVMTKKNIKSSIQTNTGTVVTYGF